MVVADTHSQNFQTRRKTMSQGFFKSKINYLIEVIKETTILKLNEVKDEPEIHLQDFTEEL